jgi:hypothetical protein
MAHPLIDLLLTFWPYDVDATPENFDYLFRIDGVEFYLANNLRIREKRFRDCDAYTNGQDVYIKYRSLVTVETIQHELAHVRQARRMGWWFWVKYQWFNWTIGYSANPFEIEAQRAESRPAGRRVRRALRGFARKQ